MKCEISEQLVSKIKKLLALGKSDNINEASLAMEKAQKLCLEHDIDLCSINIDTPAKTQEPIIQESIDQKKRLGTVQKYISWLLNKHFNVKVIYTGNRYFGRQINLIGKKIDIELARYIQSYLSDLLPKLWHEYYHSTPGVRLDEKHSYIYGLYQGICEKLRESKEKVKEEKFELVGAQRGEEVKERLKQNYSLMVISDHDRINQKVEEYYPNLRSNKIYVDFSSHDALQDGKEKGRKISLNRPIGNSSNKYLS